MTWRKTLAYWVLFAVMGAYFAALERKPPPPEPEVVRERLLPVFSDEVVRFALERDGRQVMAEKNDKRWKIVTPADAKVSHDLVQALVEALTDKQESEVVRDAPDDEDLMAFGLAEPKTMIELESRNGQKARVWTGASNPPRTAVYMRTSLSPRVLLAGINVSYYGDLVYEGGYPASKRNPN